MMTLFNTDVTAQATITTADGPPVRELTLTTQQQDYYKQFLDETNCTVYNIIFSAQEWKRYIDSSFNSSVLTKEFKSGHGKPIRLNTWITDVAPLEVFEEDLTLTELEQYNQALEYMGDCWQVRLFLPQMQSTIIQSILIPVTSANKVREGSIRVNHVSQVTGANSLLLKTENSPWLVPMELTINTSDKLLGQGFTCYNFDTTGKIKNNTPITSSMRTAPTLPVFQKDSLLTVQVDPTSHSDFLFSGNNTQRVKDVQSQG